MAKISIQQNPTFKVDVEIPRIGDKVVKVPFVFAYLNRDELAEFADASLRNGKELRDLIEMTLLKMGLEVDTADGVIAAKKKLDSQPYA